jgi:N-acetylmuramoyl-L-alanine amidase
MKICISSGHGLYVRGASGILDEVDEARLVTEALADVLVAAGHDVKTYHDDVSHSQGENLERITDWHNAQGPHDLDISVHFNASEQTSAPVGVEVLYYSQKELAYKLSAAIAEVGLKDRGGKYRDDLYVLSNCIAPTVLLEICFCDSEADCEIYRERFDDIIANIAGLAGSETIVPLPAPDEAALFHVKGRCSYFGGPDDLGVSSSEGLAFHFEITEANQHLFLPLQPAGTTGLARRLNSYAVPYVACRWDYDATPKEMLASGGIMALVKNMRTGAALMAFPADWGPHEEETGRAADLSPALMAYLGLITDDEVEVIYPWEG